MPGSNPFEATLTPEAPAQKPIDVNPYDETLRQVSTESEVRMRSSFAQTADVAPDTAAEARRLSLKFGVPPAQIQRNLADYQKQGQLDQPYAHMQAQTPKLATWLEAPENAAVAKDDLENLGLLEWLVTAPQRAFASTINAQRYAALRFKEVRGLTLTQDEHDRLESYRYQMDADNAVGRGHSWFKGAITGSASFLANQAPVLKYGLGGAAVGAAGGSVLPGVGTVAGAGYGFHAGVIAGVLKSTFEQESANAYDEYQNFRDELGRPLDPAVVRAAALATGFINAPIEAGAQEFLLKSIPGLKDLGAAGIRNAVAVALKNPTVRAALLDAAKSYGTTLAAETGQEVAQRGVTILLGELAKASEKRSLAPGQVAAGNIDLTQQPRVTNEDGSVSTVDSLSVNIDGKEVLLPTVTPDGRHFTGTPAEKTKQAINEYQKTGRSLGTFETPDAANAYAEKLHDDYAAGKYDQPFKKTSSAAGLESIVLDLAQEGAGALQSFALGVLPGPLMHAVRGHVQAQAAQRTKQMFVALGEGIQQSKTFERMPEAAQAFLEHATKDGPVEKVYAPVETWEQYWQDKGVDPAAMAAEVTGSRDAYERAQATGEDLEIPTARYAVKLAGTEHNAFFADELRLKPGEMNAREAQAFLETPPETAEDVAPSETAGIRETLVAQLEASGVPASTADSYATLYESVFQNLGERAGMAPEQLFNRYGLEVTREGATAGQAPGVAVAAAQAPAFEQVTAPLTTDEVQQLDRRRAQQGPPTGKADRRQALSTDPAAPENQQIDLTSIGAAASRMIAEDPTLLQRASSMRRQAMEKGRSNKGPALTVDLAPASVQTVERDTGTKSDSAQPSQGRGLSFRGIEASTPLSRRESAKQRTSRRSEHYAAIFGAVLDAARQVDPTVEEAGLRREFEDRIEFLEAGEQEFKASGHDPLDLLRTIAANGGISLAAERGGLEGELRWLRDSPALGPFGSYGGVRGVFQSMQAGGRGGGNRTGLSLDDALTSLRQDARFAHLETINDLLAALEDVARMESVDRGSRFYGSDELQRRAGINPTVRWWEGETGFSQSAFHGSPHAFEQFTLQAIGTGEGAQAYGWGLYFASQRETAEYYRDQLSHDVPAFDGVPTKTAAETLAHDILSKYRDKGLALQIAQVYINGGMFKGDNETTAKADLFAAIEANAEKTPDMVKQGRLYEVEIPEDDQYLEWEKPASQQSPKVQAALRALGITWETFKPKSVANFYRWFESKQADRLWHEDVAIRESLREAFHLAEAGDVDGLNRWQEQHQGFFAAGAIDPTGESLYGAIQQRVQSNAGTLPQWVQFHRSAEGASRALAAHGVAGIKYLDGFSRVNGEGSSNYVVFDDRLVRITEFNQGERPPVDTLDTGEEQPRLPGAEDVRDQEVETPQLEAPFALTSEAATSKGKQGSLFQERRGAIRFGPERQMNIALFANADLSTFLHESGHFFLEVLRDLASAPEANETIKADLAIVNAAFFAEGDNTTGHERFARAFEAYLMRGESPSIALRSTFARFRAWLVGVYRSIKNLNVPLDDRIRGVMDRLVATDAAIADAQAAGKMTPIFLDAKSAGMSDREFALYRRTVEDASREAQATLQTKLLAEVQREQTAAWKTRRGEIRAEVEAEVQQRPEFVALAAIQRGTFTNGEPLTPGQPPKPLKLSRAAIVAEFGKERLKTLPRPYVYSDDGGLTPAAAAELFGYSSGDELLTALSKAGSQARTIEAETDRRMIAEQGSMLLDGSLPEHAQAAAANETRDAVVRAEMKALINLKRLVQPHVDDANRQAQRERSYERRWFEAEAKLRIAMAEGRKQVEIDALQTEVDNLKRKAAGGPAVLTAAIPRAQTVTTAAKNRIAGTRIRDMRPELFWAAARKAQETAVKAAAKQDFDTAILAQQQQLLNLALYREAERALDDADSRARQAKDLNRPAARARLAKAGETYLQQVDGILDRYEFATVTGKELAKRAELRRWVAAMEGEGLSVELDERLLDESRRVNYSELTYDELVGVTDGLQQIVHLARLTLRRLQAQDQEDYLETRDAIVGGIESHGVKREVKLELLPKDKPARMIDSWFGSHTKLATFIQQLDGYVDGGPMWDAIMRPINEAATKQQSMHDAAAREMATILKAHYKGRELAHFHDQLFIPAIGASLSKEARIAVALNWGNEGNRQRLMESVRHWNAGQVQAILDTLDARDLRFVQANLDFINTFWPEIEAKQKRVFGIAPEKVDAATWTHTQHGEQRGGYYPIAYDGRLNVRQGNIIDADTTSLQKHANYAYATTKRGYTKAREERVNAPVRLELSVMGEHVESVIHDLSHHEMLIDVGRLLGDRKVQEAITSRVGDIGYRYMKGSLLDIALGLRHSASVQDQALNWIKNGTTIAGLAWNAWTAVQQPLGMFNGAARIGPQWVARGMARMFRDASTMEWSTRWVQGKSDMMRLRGDTMNREIADLRSNLKRAGGWFDNALRTVTLDTLAQEDITQSYLFLIEKAQQLADLPVWIGAYEKYLAGGETEARAIALADQAVLDSQSGGQIKDLAQVQRGGPAFRLFTAFYSYGNLIFNQTQRTIGQTNFRKAGSVGQMLGNLALIYAAPAAITVALAAAFGKEEPDDPWSFLGLMGREMLSTAFNTMILVREAGGAAQLLYGKATGTPAGAGARGYEGPTGLRFFAGLYHLAQETAQGKIDRGFVRAVEEVGGVLFHLPTAQVQRSIDGFVALDEGRTNNPLALIFGPPPKKASGQ